MFYFMFLVFGESVCSFFASRNAAGQVPKKQAKKARFIPRWRDSAREAQASTQQFLLLCT
jgi:hypothetical protein